MKKIILLLITSVMLSSCMVTRTYVGQYLDTPGRETTYAKGKQFWIFWGLLPVGSTNVNTPADGNCKIKTSYDFVDFLVTTLTGGLVSSYSIEVSTKNMRHAGTQSRHIGSSSQQGKFEIGDRIIYISPSTNKKSEGVIKHVFPKNKVLIEIESGVLETDTSNLYKI
jgi:hypothetical protein